ncbi:MAG: Rad52/Rad22 family DNA repair protein [Candidatus Kariarchaeaceae archaeon]
MKKQEIELNKLKEPIDVKWRLQSAKHGKAICIPYIDARDAQERFDEVCGMQNWSSRHKEEKGNLFCEIGVKIEDEWVWKSDVGSESSVEKEKGEASDSFKRAAVMWGVGRFLYKMDPVVLKTTTYKGKEYPFSPEKDSPIFDGTTLTRYINWLKKQ